MGLTVESLVLTAGRALAPLEERLRGGQIATLFAEIGMPASELVLAEQAVQTAVQQTADALARLPDVIAELEAAVAAQDATRTAEAVTTAMSIVQAVMSATDAVSNAVRSAAGAGGARAEVEAFASELAQRLAGYALTNYLDRERPIASHLMILLGITEADAQAATPATPAHIRRVLRTDRLSAILRDPVDVLAQIYGWGTPQFAWDVLLRRLASFLARVSDYAFVQPGAGGRPSFLRIAGIDIGPTDDPVRGVQAVLRVTSAERLDLTLPIGASVALTASADAALEVGAALQLLPPADLRVVPPTAEVAGKLRFGVQAPPAPGGPPIVVLGVAGGSRVEARTLRVAVGSDLAWNILDRHAEGSFALEAALEGGKVVLSLAGADGFLAAILPSGPIELGADLLVSWSHQDGIRIHGGAGLRTSIALHSTAGPLRLDTLNLALEPATDSIALAATLTGAITLGPLLATVDGVGTAAELRFERGNIGPVDFDFRFVPPNGVGLEIDAPAVVGGGFLRFDPPKEEYSGMLELQIAETIAVKATGLLSTRMPDGAKGYSLLIIITAEGFEPVPLGYGFTLIDIGGLLGINRTFAEEVLRAGLKNHALDSVLFPRDPIRNAPQILSNLNSVFPPADGHHLFGPMAQITWGTPPLITADLGLVLEFGARLRLLILAQVVAILPKPQNELIRLQMDALGVLDFDQGTASLDATLYDSRLLKKFVLTGDMAMRLKWEGSPNFALAVGGLHPAFNPPANFPKLDRIALNLGSDNPRLRCEAYFAITANTVQFGAHAELTASAAGFTLAGQAGFDVLIQLAPFAFLAEFYAQLQLKRGSANLFKVRVEGALAGPRPLNLKAKATFEILWWDVTVRVDATLVDGEAPPLPSPIDVFALLSDALNSASNWTSQLPTGQRQVVTFRAATAAAADTLLHPLGTLSIKQTVVPLDLDISRFGSTTPAGARRFSITSVVLGGQDPTVQPLVLGGQDPTVQPLRDFFAPAQFIEMSDDEKLARPSFESMNGGVRVGSAQFAITPNDGDWLEVPAIEFETLIVDPNGDTRPSPPPGHTTTRYRLTPILLGMQARFGAAGSGALRRTGKARYRSTADKYQVTRDGWTVASTDDLTVQTAPASYSEAVEALTTIRQQQPSRAGALTIVRRSELSLA